MSLIRSILTKVSSIPIDYLQQVDDFLTELNSEIESAKKENRNEILAFAGSWADMSDDDYLEVLSVAKSTVIIEDRDFDI